MRYYLFTIFLSIILVSCSSLTRNEQDIYTITELDTTRTLVVENAPGNRDNGVIFPSTRTIKEERQVKRRDSLVNRYYPNFIRAGLFESVGTIGGSPDYGIGTGLFGIMPNFKNISKSYRGESGKIFTGGIYRLGIFEWKLNIFEDSPSWTYGTIGYEAIIPDGRGENILISVAPFYIRKRIFLRNEIPYISFTPYFGVGLFPSIYTNFGASLDFGSIGGLNLRAYTGIALGYNGSYTAQISDNDFASGSNSVIFPYLGLGISVLDFLNLDEDLEIEWKDYKHSSWDVGFLQLVFLNTGAEKSIFDVSGQNKSVITGISIKLANANIALPYQNYHLYFGTSLFNLTSVGWNEFAISILPVRFGYWYNIVPTELNLEPFVEFGYYPMTSINLGGKLSLRINEIFNLSLNTGFIYAKADLDFGRDITEQLGYSVDFSKFYIGLGINFYDRIFRKNELRYFK